MRKIYTRPNNESTLQHEIMPPHRAAIATASPPSAPPMDVPAPVGVSLMC